MITVQPDVIPAGGPAQISHSGSGPLTISITGSDGTTQTIVVPANSTKSWTPPPGWTSATFKATGHDDVFRLIGEGEGEGAGA